MRVLQLGKYYFPDKGGIETHLYTIADALRGKVDLEVVVSSANHRTLRDVVQGVSVTRCGSLARIASTSVSPAMALELSRREYDVMHVHLPNPMGAASYLASRKPHRHRLVVTYHSDVIRQHHLLALYAPLVERLLGRADTIIATSPNYLESSEVLRRYREKCRIIPLGIDPARFDRTHAVETKARALRERLGATQVLLGVGRLVYYKGFEFAIRALPSLPGAHLVIVGEGPLRANLRALSNELGVAKRLHLPGHVSDSELPAYYHASDIYVLPSIARSEAFGLVQVEAMAAGLPVVNTSLNSGVPFVSRHGESGLTVPPEDSNALASAIGRLLADPDLRKHMGLSGRRRVERDFTNEILARRLLAVYEGRSGTD